MKRSNNARSDDQRAMMNGGGHLAEALEKKIAILPGSRDRDHRPILIFPHQPDHSLYAYQDSLAVISYLAAVPGEKDVRSGFTVIIDMRNANIKQLKTILKTVQNVLYNKIARVLIVKPEQFFEKQRLNLDLKLEAFDFKIEMVSIHKLTKYVDVNALPNFLGGTYDYEHRFWLEVRQKYENFLRQCSELLKWLEQDKVSDGLDPLRLPSYGDEKKDYYESLVPKIFREGSELVVSMKKCRFGGDYNRDFAVMAQRIETLLHEIKELKESKNEILNQQEKKRHERRDRIVFEQFSMGVENFADWILGPGEKWLLTLHEIGESKEEAEQLEREHAQLHEKAQEILAQENELALLADRLIDLNHPLKAEVKKKRDYMDEITRIFTSRVSRQREVVAMSVHFHHLVNKLTAQLDEVLESLCSDVSASDAQECRAALETLDIKINEINKASTMVIAEGQKLQQYLGLKESNSLGHEVTRDYFPAIIHVTQTVNALKDRKQRCNDLADVRRLKLQQMLQLFTCENDIEQAIKWICDLGETAVMQHSSFVYTLEGIANARCECEKLEKTEQSTYEYGFHLVQVSFLLRRFCRLDMSRNKELRNELEKFHKLFKKVLYEWMSYIDLSFAFANNVKTVNAHLEDLYSQLNELRPLPANSAEKVRVMETIRKSLSVVSVDVDKLHHVADEMIARMKQPLLTSKREPRTDMLAKRDESMRTVKERMVQIERKKRVLEGFFTDGRPA